MEAEAPGSNQPEFPLSGFTELHISSFTKKKETTTVGNPA